MRIWIFPLVLLTVVLGCKGAVAQGGVIAGPGFKATELCGRLAEIKEVPFEGNHGRDPIFNGLIDEGVTAVPCLIEQIANGTKMRDPESVPTPPDFCVGDPAFILLLQITNIRMEEMLPNSVTARFPKIGVYAYFEWSRSSEHRRWLQAKGRTWLNAQKQPT